MQSEIDKSKNRKSLRIALTGGIACGKSLVARYLNELGVETIDADDIVHELLPDPAERKRIAAEVFADPEKRRELEARLHPLVKARINDFLLRQLQDQGEGRARPSAASGLRPRLGSRPHRNEPATAGCGQVRTRQSASLPDLQPRLAIIPLLFETHWDADYDIICCVKSERSVQIERMMTTRGYTREEAEARLAAQLPVEEKAAKSHYVIENDGSAEELKSKVMKFVDWLRK